jgi:hypothetical protein
MFNHRSRQTLGLIVAATAALTMATACEETPVGPEGPEGPGECIPTETYFADEVWNTFMGTDCLGCHNAQGIARQSDLVLQSASQPGYLRANLASVQNVAEYERDGLSVLLLKPTAAVEHGGARRFEEGSDEYQALEGLIERFNNPVDCEVEVGDAFEGVVYAPHDDTLRKAAITLVGRLPTDDEYAIVREDGLPGLEFVLDGMMMEEAFYDRMVELYNDHFLTDRYLGGNDALNLLDDDDFPNKYWDEALDEGTYNPEFIELAQRNTNNSVARAPLALVRHVVENDLPFSEIITADYMMVNAYSAKVYQVEDQVTFDDPSDPNEWQVARLDGVPHSGVLTSPMFLNRFPTTDTNRNRHRSRMVYKFFLATDILALADRVNADSIAGLNPTMNDPVCTVCHDNLDPVAGAFQNWDDQGRYRPPEGGWFADMRPPGYKGEVMPASEWGGSLQWIGQRVADDPLFHTATVHTIYQGLTGQEPLRPTLDPDGAEAQEVIFTQIAERFAEKDMNVKEVVKGVILSPYFRAVDANVEKPELAEVGTARFLTPEILDRKIETVMGAPWSRGYDGRPYLLDTNEYRIYYGGHDSDGVISRITEPNGLMAAVARRMANDVACATVARDFTRYPENRLLFPYVERTYEPVDQNGFPIAGAEAAIKANIQYLHLRILGEKLDLEDTDIDRTYHLFLQTWQEGRDGVIADEINDYMDYSCRATVDPYTGEDLPEEQQVYRDENYITRAWMAVTAYMLSDYRFLHE